MFVYQSFFYAISGLALMIPFGNVAWAQAPVQAWAQQFNGMADLDAHAQKIALDSFGNVIVVGHSTLVGREDWFVVKYSSAGAGLWTNNYGGPVENNNYERPTAVSVASNGNIYVTGYSTGIGSSYDYVTIAYTGAGMPLWTNRYNGPGNSSDQAAALAIDTSGSVFVTGFSAGSSSGNDFATIAYNESGVALWTNRYNGSANSYDYATALVVDSVGSVLVTGVSVGAGSGDDYVTIKYSSVGLPLWTNRYNGPANSADRATALAVDASGNLSVAGYSFNTDGSYDYATIAYTSVGVPAWTNRYSGAGAYYDAPTAITADGNGNVFVTGDSYGSTSFADLATIAYSSGGVPLWTNRYNGVANNYDQASAIGRDADGNIFVTGYSYGVGSTNDYIIIKYSNSGVALWTNRYNGPGNDSDTANALAVDANGNMIVTGSSLGAGSSGFDACTIAYSNSGVPLWTNRYLGLAAGNSTVADMVMDGTGNVVVTGFSPGPGSSFDFLTIKYSSSGAALWTNRYNGLGNVSDEATALAAESNGNVYVTGHSARDFTTIAYSNAGVPLWTNRYSGSGNYDDSPDAIVVSGNGNVIVTGDSYNGANSDYATIAYSNAGVPLWTNRYNGPGNDADHANALTTDGGGNVIVTGYSVGAGSGADYATIKYSSVGVPLWTQRYNGPANSYDSAYAVRTDVAGNVFVTGFSTGIRNTRDYTTIKYSGGGVALWTNRYNGPANKDDLANALAIDNSGNVFVTGYSVGTGSSNDFVTIKYSGVGLPLWTNRYNGSANGADSAVALIIDGGGNVIVTGSSAGVGSGSDIATIAYSNIGLPLWTNCYNGSGNNDDFSAALSAGSDGSVFVTGGSRGLGSKYEYTTIKYAVVPGFVTPPVDLLVPWGSNATFSATAWGASPLTYQWFFNGTPITDATNILLVIEGAVFTNQGGYSLVVSNFSGSVTSSVASLSVAITPPLSIAAASGLIGFTNGSFGFNVTGPLGLNAVIQASSNLQHWVSIQTNVINNTPLFVTDPESQTESIRFYRAMLILR